ncbi:MAG: TonB-dependent receptor, partial [Pseudomonadales bacterium]|nr:TonB-dependent receptor [Pseudomonadales bacterium]
QQLHIPTIVYHNIAGSYQYNEQFNIRLGVDNFTDKQPPVSRVNLNINFDQQTYSAVGLFMYLQVSYAL